MPILHPHQRPSFACGYYSIYDQPLSITCMAARLLLPNRKTDKPQSILGHNPRLPCINVDDIIPIGEALGVGAQGTVLKVHTKMIGTCAWKKFRDDVNVINFGRGDFANQNVLNSPNVDLAREVKFSFEVDNHPNIVKFYAYSTVFKNDKQNNPKPFAHRGILFEYMPGGSLEQYLEGGEKYHLQSKVITIDRVHKWALQIARALAFCHNVHNVIHRDVKPSNILLSDDYETVKLTDFGIARKNDGIKSVGKGTPQFQAPEVYCSSEYDEKADVYSFGCLLYAMTTSRRPFDDVIAQFNKNLPQFFNYLTNDKNRPPLAKEESFKKLNKIIEKSWQFEASKRPKMIDIVCDLDRSS